MGWLLMQYVESAESFFHSKKDGFRVMVRFDTHPKVLQKWILLLRPQVDLLQSNAFPGPSQCSIVSTNCTNSKSAEWKSASFGSNPVPYPKQFRHQSVPEAWNYLSLFSHWKAEISVSWSFGKLSVFAKFKCRPFEVQSLRFLALRKFYGLSIGCAPHQRGLCWSLRLLPYNFHHCHSSHEKPLLLMLKIISEILRLLFISSFQISIIKRANCWFIFTIKI